MPRIRTIKPELYRHEELFEAELATGLPLRIAFTGLFACADREGRFRWLPRRLKLDVLPYDTLDFEEVLEAFETHGFIIKYSVEGSVYGFIPSFIHHQRPTRDEPASEIPAPEEAAKREFNRPPNHTMRLRVYERDQYKCVYCLEDLSQRSRSICLDHVVPLVQKGSHHESNLATSCKKCRAYKGDCTPTECELPWPKGLGCVSGDSGLEIGVSVSSSVESKGDPWVADPHRSPRSHPVNEENIQPDGSNNCLKVLPTPVNTPVNALKSTLHAFGHSVNTPSTDGQGWYGGEREREQDREGNKSIVAPVRQCVDESPPVLFVFDFWKSRLGHPKAVLDKKRKAWISQALKSGYSPEQLCQAITGCSVTPHNMGKNEQGQRYDGLHVILKDADQIDRFIQNATSPPQLRNRAQSLTESNLAACQGWLDEQEVGEDSDEVQ